MQATSWVMYRTTILEVTLYTNFQLNPAMLANCKMISFLQLQQVRCIALLSLQMELYTHGVEGRCVSFDRAVPLSFSHIAMAAWPLGARVLAVGAHAAAGCRAAWHSGCIRRMRVR